jgi:hypothetical protein
MANEIDSLCGTIYVLCAPLFPVVVRVLCLLLVLSLLLLLPLLVVALEMDRYVTVVLVNM